MFSLYGQNGQIAHGIREYMCDTKDDVKDLPVNISPGSMAFIIDTGDLYILNHSREWVLLDDKD